MSPYADPEAQRAYHKAYYEAHRTLVGPHQKTPEHVEKMRAGASRFSAERAARERAEGKYKCRPHTKDGAGIRLLSHVVWERANGRPLRPDEIVHHIDGDPFNNAPENLQAMTQPEHIRLHGLPGHNRARGEE